MLISYGQYFLLFSATFFLVGLLTPLMRRLAISKGILDRPESLHKTHLTPVPYLGGVAIIIGVTLATYSALLFSNFMLNSFWLATSILVPAMALGLIGLWDDVRNLHPFPRFIGQTLAGVAVALLLIVNNNQGNPTNFPLLDVFITILWIVGICNSINFFDNLDGGAAGTVAVSTTTLAYLAVNNNQSLIGALSFVVAGSTLGFLVWNRSPARIYMGDAGSLFLGILLATLTLRFDPNTETSLASFATPILLLAIPILDTTVAVVSRLLRNVSPFKGGKDHLSHRLIRAGLTRKHSAILLWLLSAFFCLLAILFTLLNSYYEIVIIIFASILWALLFFGFVLTADY